MSSAEVGEAKGRTADGPEPGLRPLVAMLAADVLAVHLEAPAEREVEVSLQVEGSAAALTPHSLTHPATVGNGPGHLFVAVIGGVPAGGDALLRIDAGGNELELGPAPLRALCIDLRGFLRERLGALPREDRDAVLALLADAAAATPTTVDPLGLATSMALMREGLREPLPPSVVERDEPQGLDFDSIIALSDRAFYVRGWARDAQAALTRLTLVSPEGSRTELLSHSFRNPRPDVDSFYEQPTHSGGAETGFLAYCETGAPSYASEGWILEMENSLGVAREVSGPTVTRDLLGSRAGILSDLHKERSWDTPLMDHVVPAISRIQEQLDSRTEIKEVFQYGEPPADPRTSIVIPLYGRIDFLEQQLAQFVHDPELREADLIYVLDSPDLAPALEDLAGQIFELYRLPFRTVVLSRNGGYSVANNRGASLARGQLLLLLNSDVLPDRPGWLSALATFYEEQEEIGALGPKLLFEDDTLQHAGIRFQRPPGGGAWENQHYFKGLHRDLPAANVTRRVPAVSGACLMIGRGTYEELDGLSGMYVQGDYEDTDLCLRLKEAGLDTWYLPTVELYHLEGQSYALETRQAMSRYNIWLHSRTWDPQIERAVAEMTAAQPRGEQA